MAVFVRLQRQNALVHVFSRTGTQDDFLFFSGTLIQFFRIINSRKKNANIWRTIGDGISAIKFEATRPPFLSDVFVFVRVDIVVAFRLPNNTTDTLLTNSSCPILAKFSENGSFINSFFLQSASEQEVTEICCSFRSGTSPGYDSIGMLLIKESFNLIWAPLTYI